MINIVFANSSDRWIRSRSTSSYANALFGNALTLNEDDIAVVGQTYASSEGAWYVRQYFMEFPYSRDAGQIAVSGHFRLQNSVTHGTNVSRDVEVREYDWEEPGEVTIEPDRGDWRTPSLGISPLTISGRFERLLADDAPEAVAVTLLHRKGYFQQGIGPDGQQVEEPDEAKAVLMMRGVASVMEKHHRVQILDEALEAAVKLSHRYIPARQLPDKSVSLLDTACARVAISQHAVPGEVDDSRKRIVALETEIGIIGREKAIGIDVTEREDVVSCAAPQRVVAATHEQDVVALATSPPFQIP